MVTTGRTQFVLWYAYRICSLFENVDDTFIRLKLFDVFG